jgi:hypothetical protein
MATTTKQASGIDMTAFAEQLMSTIATLTPPAASVPPSRPSILVRVSRREISQAEADGIGLTDRQQGAYARLTHGELSQGQLFGTVLDSSAMTVNGVEYLQGELTDLRTRLPMSNDKDAAVQKIYAILSSIDLSYHRQLDGKPSPEGSISFAVRVTADSFKIMEAINDGEYEPVPFGNIVIGFPEPVPSNREIPNFTKEAADLKRKAKATDNQARNASRLSRRAAATGASPTDLANNIDAVIASQVPESAALATSDY